MESFWEIIIDSLLLATKVLVVCVVLELVLLLIGSDFHLPYIGAWVERGFAYLVYLWPF